ncbi:glycosyltransferase family 39 protein [Streptomyces sp. GMY02]|uniref:ArnT family glycosyltransferase n=1 Tax=Streptomyces sp. GMY02 TaxID=1333528 RepID=UPI001C2B7A48|nr:glycosyltransferase family 39 protein [Streptomyces sp. GMY02]QXE38967.1 glycosyltransferase family 39 protein [Streptomyces sp. GMY02]
MRYGPPGRRTAPAAAPRTTGYWRRLLPALALLVLVTRIPSLRHPLWSPDEGYLAVQARILADGGALYETVVDRKPPLLPWLYETAFTLFGDESLYAMKALAVLAHLLTAVLLAAVARDRWGDRAGRIAGVLHPLLATGLNPEDTQAATFEVFILPFTAAAMWCAGRGRAGAAGLAVAGALLTKQTGGAVLVPVLWLLRHSAARGARSGAGAAGRAGLPRLAAGLVLPVLGAALLTDPAGFLFWTVTGSAAYATFTGSELHVLFRGLANTALLCLACAGLPTSLVRARRGTADLWVWLAASAVAVVAGFHFFGHYFLQLVPPLVLLATAALRPLHPERVASALLTTGCVCVLFLAWGLLAPRPELVHAQRLADSVRALTAPADRILVWGIHPETYWLADRTPASRYLTAGLLTNYSGGRDGPGVGEKYGVAGAWPVFTAELRARPPALIVDDSRGKPFAPDRLPTLRALLARHYEPLPATVDGAVFYVRSPGSARQETDALYGRPPGG